MHCLSTYGGLTDKALYSASFGSCNPQLQQNGPRINPTLKINEKNTAQTRWNYIALDWLLHVYCLIFDTYVSGQTKLSCQHSQIANIPT
jgi:hypothetical protein